MKTIMCLYMAYCLWGLWYVSIMMPPVSIPNIAAFMAVSSAVLAYVDRGLHNWFK